MGNANTKESRPPADTHRFERNDLRARRSSRAGDAASFLGLNPVHRDRDRDRDRDRQNIQFEHRETKQEREARRLQRERAARLKEREKSLREEHVDGGYLVTLGTYTGTEDFNKNVVRQLQIERRLAPFWRGLNDWSENWAEHQVVAAARGLAVPPADEPPPHDLSNPQDKHEDSSQTNLQNLTVPIGNRTISIASEQGGSSPGQALPSPGTPRSSIKPRAKAIAKALTGQSRNTSSTELSPSETMLPHDPFVNGQIMELYLYKDAEECPICFLSYPPYLNSTRCCDQAICSECFVQIKRPDPHFREYHPGSQPSHADDDVNSEGLAGELISEPSTCPYCQQPEFGVTYVPPPFRRGIVYSKLPNNAPSSSAMSPMSPMSSQSSLHSTATPSQQASPRANRKRGHSLSASAPNVITTDKIRPDWSSKLLAARSHQARRSAAATALHAAAFFAGGSDQRPILRSGRFSRRNHESATSTHLMNTSTIESIDGNESTGGEFGVYGTRRSRMEDLEEMMFLEAVRLSLAAEEVRKDKEEKARQKDIEKKEAAKKKAAKKAAKNPYGGSFGGASASSLSLGLSRKRGNSGASNLRTETTQAGASEASKLGDTAQESIQHVEHVAFGQDNGKGKSVHRTTHDTLPAQGRSLLGIPIPSNGPQLEQNSNASSLMSSPPGSTTGSYSSSGLLNVDSTRQTRGDGDGEELSESMFNFRSLAEQAGVNIDEGTATSEGNDTEEATNHGDNDSAHTLSQVREENQDCPNINPGP